jgi:hypothetical protein
MAALIRITRRAAWPLLAAFALAVSGCANPFKPATPEPPDASGLVEDFSTPPKLLATLEAAMSNKSAGRVAWADAMAASPAQVFSATPDPRVLSAWQLSSPVPPPDPWDLENERLFYDKFASLYPYDYAMAFNTDPTSPNDVVDDAAGTGLVHRSYVISMNPPNASEAVIIAIGYVDLYIVKYDGRWWVLRWEDRLDPRIGVDPVDQNYRTLGWRRLDSVSSSS